MEQGGGEERRDLGKEGFRASKGCQSTCIDAHEGSRVTYSPNGLLSMVWFFCLKD